MRRSTRVRQSARMSPDASWTFDPGVVIALTLYLGHYLVRWRRARTPDEPHSPFGWRPLVFVTGGSGLVPSLCSPSDLLFGHCLAMHLVHHGPLLDVSPL